MKVILAFCVCLLLLTACEIKAGPEYVLPDPSVQNHMTGIDSSSLQIEMLERVTTKSAEINVKITGSNIADNGLYYFLVPVLERNESGTWRRIAVNANFWEQITGDPDYYWSPCYREDGSSEMWTTATVFVSDLAEQIKLGQYRITLFFPDRTLYVGFTVDE